MQKTGNITSPDMSCLPLQMGRWAMPKCLSILIICLIVQSCKKLVEVKAPSTSINSGNVYASDATAIAAITDMYAAISRTALPDGGIASISLFPSLSSDELSLYNGSTNNAVNFYYKNQLSDINISSPDFWTSFYHTIYVANSAMEELTKSATLNPAIKKQLFGEAKFMRAFSYFYLVNLYGDIPLAISTDYTMNSSLIRKSKTDVYNQMIVDLKDAQDLLSAQYPDATLLNATSERVRPTKWAATALLARAYLYNGDFSNAENEATTVINNSAVFSLTTLNNVFLKNSHEAIWQLQPVNAGWNTEDAKAFLLPASGPDAGFNSFYLSPQLLSSFESNDQRKMNWVNSVTVGVNTYAYPYKYKSATFNAPVTEYKMVLRLAEQYLIRAEARARQNKIAEAKDDLTILRNRAGLGAVAANDQASMLHAILKEKQVELFTEWGHRWFDLKRTGNVDVIMNVVTPQKGGSWNTNWQLYPITRNELLANPNLVQNAEY